MTNIFKPSNPLLRIFQQLSKISVRSVKNVNIIVLLVLCSFLTNKTEAQVSLSFSKGYFGVQGSNTNQANNIKNLATIGIARVSFGQGYAAAFGGTQGNDLDGTLKIYLIPGATSAQAVNNVITLSGALNWRETTGSTVEVFGFIFAPSVSASITFSGQTYNIVGGDTRNSSTTLGLKAYASTFTFTNTQDRSGNAATSGLIDDLNAELASSPQPSTITLTSNSVTEGQNLIFNVALTSAPTAGNPQVLTFTSAGTATSSGDYTTTYTFSNGVTDNGDGTITIPAGVSSFTVTVNTIDDVAQELTETLILRIGSKSATGNILDNDAVSTITTTGTLKTFSTCSGCTVIPQTFSVSGDFLNADLTISAPTGFEVSTTSNSGYASIIYITPITGTITTTTIYARLTNNAITASSGTITLTSSGATSKTVTVTTNNDNALNFTGTSYISLPGSLGSAYNSSAFTVEAWIKTTETKAINEIIAWGSTTASNNVVEFRTTGGKLQFLLNNGLGGAGYYQLTGNSNLNSGKWVHVAAVKSGSNVVLYVNGQVDATGSGVTSSPSLNSANIGLLAYNNGSGYNNNVTSYFNGTIDQLRVWNTAKTSSDILTNMNVQMAGNEIDLVANYDFNQGIANSTNSISTLNDNSLVLKNGTLNNFALTGSTSNFVDGFIPSITAAGNATTLVSSNTLSLTNSLSGGVWSSSNSSVASVNANTGLVTGVAGGNVTISYTICNKTSTYTLTIIQAPSVTSTSLKPFTSCSGCTFTPQSIAVAGADLTSNVIITAPTGLQIATAANGTYTSTITLTQSGGTLSSTNIFVRLTNSAIAAASGNLTITSTGAVPKTVTITVNTDNALNLDGINDMVTIADNNALDLTTNYTIETWIKPTAFNALAGIVSKYHSSSSNGYILRLTATGDFSGISFDEMNSSNGVLALNKWYHIAAVNNNGTRKLYINGIEQALSGTPITTAANSDPVIIGQDFSSSGSRFFKGSIDEVRIWNTARTATEITNNMNVALVGNEAGLVANYTFNQGVANGTNTTTTTLYDATANALSGTISGVTLTGNNSNFVDGFMPSITAAGNASELLVGKTLALSNILTGGVWSSTNNTFATVNSATGVVTGVATGAVTLTYTICGKTTAYPLNIVVISTTGTLTPFSTCFGIASGTQSITVAATTLTNNLVITAPPGYELSTSVGGAYTASITLTPISGNITNTALYIRLSTQSFNGDHGNITFTSGSATKLFPIPLASVKLNVPARVTISSNAPSNTICTGTAVTFTASASNGGSTPTYQWKLNGTNVGANSATYSNTSLANNDIVTMIMTSNIPSCVTGSPVTSNAITMKVVSVPVTPTSINGITNLCLGSNAAYTTNNVAFATSYDWVISGNLTATASSSNAINTFAGSAGAATIKVRAINACGASNYTSDLNLNISNTPAPTANFTLSNDQVCIGVTNINFTSTSTVNGTTNSPITSYDWNFGDGSPAGTTQNVSKNYAGHGKYNVILLIQSQDNCASSISKTVVVNPLSVAGTVSVLDPIICQGTSTTISLTGYTGNIQWMSSPTGANTWSNIPGANNEVLNTGNLSASTDFKAEVRSGVCTVATSATVSVTVKVPPSINIFPPTGVSITDTTFNLAYVVTSGNPNAYNVDVFGSNPMPNFTPNLLYALRSSPLTIAIPPSALGNYVFSISVTELPWACYPQGNGNPLTFTLGVGPGSAGPSLTYNTPNVYTVGTAISSLTPTVTGGTISSCTITPNLPAGLTLDPNTGIISGTPSAVSSQTSYVITGTISSTTVSATVVITVNDAPPSTLSYTSPNIYRVGVAITHLNPTSTGGAISAYAISPNLPAGLTINATTGVISGTPSAVSSQTAYVVTGTNSFGTVTATVVITVKVYIPAPAPPTVQNGRFIFGKSVLPSTLNSFVSPLPTGVVPVWCTIGTQNCSTTVPLMPTAIGRYIYQLRSLDTAYQLYSTNFVNDTIVIAPVAPTAIDSTYILGVVGNPTNVAIQVSTLNGASVKYYYQGIQQVNTPVIGTVFGTKRYVVTQTVNNIESDSTNFNVTLLDPASVIHLQKIVDSGLLQSNLTYNFPFKLVVSNLTNTPFTNVVVTDNLQYSVPITCEYSIVNNATTGGLNPNTLFNGNGDINVTLPTSTLAPMAKDTSKFVMNLVPKGFSGSLKNVAYVTAKTRWGTIVMQSSSATKANETSKLPTYYYVNDLVISIPEGFSPNNDGVHDYFIVVRPPNMTLELEIFNRWGNVVYSNSNYNNDWNGKGSGNFTGQDLVDGGYYYSLRAVDITGKVQVFKGFVIIQR